MIEYRWVVPEHRDVLAIVRTWPNVTTREVTESLDWTDDDRDWNCRTASVRTTLNELLDMGLVTVDRSGRGRGAQRWSTP